MPVKGYEGLYEVSNNGRVRSLNYNHTGNVKELSPRDNGSGYLYVYLCREGKHKNFRVHRLVAEAFIGEIPKGLIVNHKDENPQNNNVNNLEICTYEYNNNYGTRNKRASAAMKGKKNRLGKTHSPETRAKISVALKGKQLSPEHRAKISAAMKVKKKALNSALKN